MWLIFFSKCTVHIAYFFLNGGFTVNVFIWKNFTHHLHTRQRNFLCSKSFNTFYTNFRTCVHHSVLKMAKKAQFMELPRNVKKKQIPNSWLSSGRRHRRTNNNYHIYLNKRPAFYFQGRVLNWWHIWIICGIVIKFFSKSGLLGGKYSLIQIMPKRRHFNKDWPSIFVDTVSTQRPRNEQGY